jgi:tripartite-type tricarboxylate transporter receptor subunit TctC
VLRALAVASGRRTARLPSVPTLPEAGVEADAWFALFAPAKTPPAATDRLFQAAAVRSAAMQQSPHSPRRA